MNRILAVLIGGLLTFGAAAQAQRPARSNIEFDTTEVTAMTIDVSPDGRTLVFDLLGDIYTMPASGGRATKVLGGGSWDVTPRFTASGGIVFASDRSDEFRTLWELPRGASEPRRLSSEPMSAPVAIGRCVFGLSYGPNSEYAPNYVRVDGRGHCRAGQERLVVSLSPVRGGAPYMSEVFEIDQHTGERRRITRGEVARSSHDGRRVAFVRGDNPTGYRLENLALWIRDIQTGEERRLISLGAGSFSQPNFDHAWQLPQFAFSPDDRFIFIAVEGRPARIDTRTGELAHLPFAARVSQEVLVRGEPGLAISDDTFTVRQLRWAQVSNDRNIAAFSALGQIWTADLTTGQTVQLTQGRELHLMPAFSPDGAYLAFVSWSEGQGGQIYVQDLRNGAMHQITQTQSVYANPTWSPDGSSLAFIDAGTDRSERVSVYVTPARGGASRLLGELGAIGMRVANRSLPPLAFSRDGGRIFVGVYTARQCLQMWALDVRQNNPRGAACIGDSELGDAPFSRVDHILVAPDARQAAIVANRELWVAPFNADEMSLSLPEARRVSATGADYVHWLDDNTLAGNLAARVEVWSLADEAQSRRRDVTIIAQRDQPTDLFAIQNVTLITMRGAEVIPRGTILVSGRDISAIGATEDVEIPPGARVFDGQGLTIIPGLVDVHAHATRIPSEVGFEASEFRDYLRHGVTTIFDPSTFSENGRFASAELVDAGLASGPRVFSTGRTIQAQDDVSSIGDARRIADLWQRSGAIYLKIYFHPQRQHQRWLMQAAAERGLRATMESGHLWDLSGFVDGMAAVEHSGFFGMPVRNDLAQFMARAGIQVTPTLNIDGYLNSNQFLADHAAEYYRGAGAFLPAEARSLDWYGAFQIRDDVQTLLRAGGHISVGYHDGRVGYDTHTEMWAMQSAGMNAHEALRAATYAGALKIGVEESIGMLSPGMLADFVVLSEDPLGDLRHSVSVVYTVKNGRIYDGVVSDPRARGWSRDPQASVH